MKEYESLLKGIKLPGFDFFDLIFKAGHSRSICRKKDYAAWDYVLGWLIEVDSIVKWHLLVETGF